MTDTRWTKLNRRLTQRGASEIPAWLAEWAYWNGKLYRLPGMPQVRAEFKYRKGNKRYGITAPIIVFQMGKVGSSSVYDSLNALDLDVPVYHAHVLNNFEVYEEGVRRTRVDPTTHLEALEEGRALRRIVDSARWSSWSLVSLVRAPIPHAVSDFFENVASYVPDFWTRWQSGAISMGELNEIFTTRYVDYSLIYWYDQQVRDVFDIDVFATPFPRSTGYGIYRSNKARLLLMRLEDLNRCVRPALKDFIGLNEFVLSTHNLGGDKAYGELYQQFLAQLRLSPAYVQEMHSTPYARHFYSTEELTASVAHWTEGGGALP